MPAQLLFAINTAAGSSGDLCGSASCTPDPVAAPAGLPIQLVTAGAGFQPHFVLLALPPVQCTPVPGFGGLLLVQPPGVAMLASFLWGHFPHAPCASRQGLQSIPLPAGLPSGFRMVLQLFAPVSFPQPQWTFSNAVEVTIL